MRCDPKTAARHVARLPGPLCVVMCGLPGTGKSTFIKLLSAELGDVPLVIVDTDSYIESEGRARGLNYSEAFKTVSFKDAKQNMNAVLAMAVAAKSSFVIDQTNVSAKSRTTKIASVPSNYTKVCVVMNVDEKELSRRLAVRSQETGKFIPPGVVADMAKSWIPPTKAEGYSEIIEVDNR